MIMKKQLQEMRDEVSRLATATNEHSEERDELFTVYCALTKAIHHIDTYNSIVWSNYNED